MSGTPSAGRRRTSEAGLAQSDSRRLASALVVAAALGLLAYALPAAADIMPSDRRTTWNPGIPGGIPARTTVCATINASTYGNGTVDATTGIQNAINACPVGQVVQLSAGNFLVNGTFPIIINKGIVLRGAGATLTKLRKTSAAANPLIVVGDRWIDEAGSTNLTANAAKGATSVQVASTAGLTVGRLVLLDELSDYSYVYWGMNCPLGAQCRDWFSRYDRPVGQILEIASINGNTVSFTTPLHIDFDTQHTAQITRYTIPYGAKFAGLEDLYVRGGRDDNITVRFAAYSWVKNVESDWSDGDSVAIDMCFRCVVRDSYFHDTPDPNPGGSGYMLSIAEMTSDSLIENNIFINGNKVMVMRASGGGNVIGYNYFDNGYIQTNQGWMETGMNAGHRAEPHFELFEGNQAFNIDGDDTWGGAIAITYFRNHATGKRRSFPDIDSRRAIGLMYGHYDYSLVGNVLGTAGQSPAPYSSFQYEDFFPWGDDPVSMYRLGYTPEDWNAQPESRVLNTLHRHANFDYATNTVRWQTGYDTTLPDSLYLSARPPFFGTLPWPWVDATGPTKLFTLPARARYDAGNPNPNTHTLSVVKLGTGTGTVTSSPAGINCGATCSASYAASTVVTLTAAPAGGSTFTGWSGACTGTGSCQVTMSAATLVNAAFTLAPVNHLLTVTRTGTGTGTVTSSPAGINCGATCSASYAASTVVTLTAAPAGGSTFTGWSGACTGTGSCQVTMNAATLVNAAFTLAPVNHLLTVTRTGTGTGTVTSSPAGINCGATCSASYAASTVVTLTAAPAGGSTFTGWSGACTGTGSCQVTMNAATLVNAAFTLAPVNHLLTVTRTGTGTGTVTSSPAGINCGATCSASYAASTVVTLTAAPAGGSTFTGWSGACTGTGSCQVTMNAATLVNAAFTLAPVNHLLTVTRTGTGTGTVTSSPAGINCGATCSASYAASTVVTLTAAPAGGSNFTGWSGACTGTGTCQVTMNAATAVTAIFSATVPPAGPLAYWKLDEGTGTTAADASGNGHTGFLINGPVWTAGRSGQALALDGINDNVRIPPAANLNVYPLTVASWFKAPPSVGSKGLVNKYLPGSLNGYQVFFYDGDLCAWLMRSSVRRIYDGTNCTLRTSGYSDNAWHHVVFVADASGGRLYVDGVQTASQPWTGAPAAPTNSQRVSVGRYPGATGGGFMAGVVDDVRIYGRALSAQEVLQLFNSMPPAEGGR